MRGNSALPVCTPDPFRVTVSVEKTLRSANVLLLLLYSTVYTWTVMHFVLFWDEMKHWLSVRDQL